MNKEYLLEEIRKTIKIDINVHDFEEFINSLVRLEVQDKLKELQKIYSDQDEGVTNE